MAATAGGKSPSAKEAIPTLALRGDLSGEFLDFNLMPELLADV